MRHKAFNKKTILIAAAVTAVGGWALFRPELLFVNETVNEKLPVAGQAEAMTLSQGTFASYAHETKGNAQIVKSGDKYYLRLTDFHTSNGPDVRVLLTRTAEPQKIEGSLDLGSIKGNIGDQNYELPADFRPEDYRGVDIWCKRFNVSFGGAPLESQVAKQSSSTESAFQLAGYELESIRVTHGPLQGTKGIAELIEDQGQRYLTLAGLKTSSALTVYLVKKETLTLKATPTTAPADKLGTLAAGAKSGRFAASKKLDVWLYRSVLLWDGKKAVGVANLRSDQELSKTVGRV